MLSMSASNGIFAPLSRDPFLFQIELTLAEGTTFDEVQEAIDKEIETLVNGEVPVDRIEAVKSHARYYFELGLETPSDVAVTLAMLISATRDPNAVDRFGEALVDVTPEKVIDAARRYLISDGRTTVTLSPEKGGAK